MRSDVGRSDLPFRDSCSPLVVAIAAVIALVIFVLPLGIGFPLLDPDEGLHAEIAREMLETGDWLMPRFLGTPFLDKPVLYCWAEAASLWMLGTSEAAVRLPGLMFGLLGAVTTGLLAGRMFGRRTGLVAGIFYATTILPTALAQAASHDVALAPWINLSVLLLWESHRGGEKEGWPSLGQPQSGPPRQIGPAALSPVSCVFGAGVFLGLSILTKGLEGPAVAGLAYGGWLIVTRRIRWCVLLRGVATLLVAAIVAAPWYLAIERQNPGYLNYFFIGRHLLGVATATQPHGNQPWWYYAPILFGGGLPWIGYLLVRGERRGKRGEEKASPAGSNAASGQPVIGQRSGVESSEHSGNLPFSISPLPLLWCWLIGWPLLLTLARSKLATYVWPAFPPMAILAAVVWLRMVDGTLSESARRAFARTFVWSCWSGPILLPATVGVVQGLFGVHFSWQVWVCTGIAAALAPAPLFAWRMANKEDGGTVLRLTRARVWREATLGAAALSMAVQFLVVVTMVLPPVAECFSARDLARYFNRKGKLPPRLWLAEQRVGSLVFYLDASLRAGLEPDQIRPLAAGRAERLDAGDVVAVPTADKYHVVPRIDLGDRPYTRVGRYRLYRLESPLCTGTQAKK